MARLSASTAPFVALRPNTTMPATILAAWDTRMTEMEIEGRMKNWMRASVIAGDLVIWISAVVVFCQTNFSKGKDALKNQGIVGPFYSISYETLVNGKASGCGSPQYPPPAWVDSDR